jgi:uncharacterized protein DUF4922
MLNEIDSLFESQRQSWPRLARGVEGLANAKTRRTHIDWFDVFVRHIPHRVASTTAPVDRESVVKRPCFLCAGNLDPEERGVPFNEDYTIYCNPFPIIDHHLTIVYGKHENQHIAGQVATMLDLGAALPGYFVIYNGPECGASAPDHMHFQAGLREPFPIEKETAAVNGVFAGKYARNLFVFRDSDRSALTDKIDRTIELLAGVTNKRPEPLINIALFREGREWTVYLFPRGKHRPQVYHSGELTVSPASIDLCGLFVVPLAKDFERITGNDIDSIFREVTLPDALCKEVAAKL